MLSCLCVSNQGQSVHKPVKAYTIARLEGGVGGDGETLSRLRQGAGSAGEMQAVPTSRVCNTGLAYQRLSTS